MKELTMDQKVRERALGRAAMSSRTEEAIVERLRALDAQEQKRVLDFVEGIERQKSQPAKTLWDAIQEIVKDVPDEVWERLPTDGSEQHDHYLYGSPKK
jgi:hypothetical protein